MHFEDQSLPVLFCTSFFSLVGFDNAVYEKMHFIVRRMGLSYYLYLTVICFCFFVSLCVSLYVEPVRFKRRKNWSLALQIITLAFSTMIFNRGERYY